jgi:AcrR family transcriptional regulator
VVRPRAENYDEKRQDILDGAAEMFAKDGFDGTGIATIAQHLGVSKALLYHYYQSKEALLYDMLFLHCQLLVQTASEAIVAQQSPQLKLQSVIRALMGLYVRSRNKHIVLLNDLHCLPQAQQRQIKNQEKKVLNVIKSAVAELRPELSAAANSALTMYLMGAINWTYTWFNPDGPLSEQQFADLATALFLTGMTGKLPI